MMLTGIGGYGYAGYGMNQYANYGGANQSQSASTLGRYAPNAEEAQNASKLGRYEADGEEKNVDPLTGQVKEDNSPDEIRRRMTGHKSTPAECETCRNRKYQDGSDEMVSFKAAGHIDPNNAAAVVMGHEQEHVSNAYQKADATGGEVVKASVTLKTAVCPECGRTYISGGETNTQIRYVNEDNPYQKDLKESDAVNKYRGANVDIAA